MWDQGYPRHHADGRRVPAAALERPDLVAHGARVPAGRARADDRPDGLERRRDAHAAIACTRSTCAACSSTTIWPRAAIWSTARPIALTDIRVPIFAVGTTDDHVAPVALGLQDHISGRHRGHLPADQRRPQRRHRQRARPPRPLLPANDLSCRHALQTARRMVRNGATPRWLLVASLARVARPTFRAAGAPPSLGAPENGYPQLDDAPGRYVHLH